MESERKEGAARMLGVGSVTAEERWAFDALAAGGRARRPLGEQALACLLRYLGEPVEGVGESPITALYRVVEAAGSELDLELELLVRQHDPETNMEHRQRLRVLRDRTGRGDGEDEDCHIVIHLRAGQTLARAGRGVQRGTADTAAPTTTIQ